jgi:hypothetical protein
MARSEPKVNAPQKQPVPSAPAPGQAAGRNAVRALSHEQVARRAFELYEARGRQPGHALEDWLQAERELSLSRR